MKKDLEQSPSIVAHPGLDIRLFQEEFCSLIGLPDTIPMAVALEQLMGGTIPNEDPEKLNYTLAFIAAQKPTSLIEAQLLVQLLSAHKLCTTMLNKASEQVWPEKIERYVNIAMKLSRGYNNGLESLAKYRRDGKQYLYIERVHIDKDANAIIGNVERGCI